MAKQRYSVGIDLGTTFSSLAYADDQGRVEALRLPDGTFQVASVVYFKRPGEVVVGTEALNYSVIDASRVARAFKRKMGEASYHFEADGKRFRPEEMSAMVLRKLLEAATAQLGPIERVVISVPFAFDEVRRRATQSAARIAGIKEIDLVDEPVAAALAYGHALIKGGGFFSVNEVYADETVLVYDLGGGTFDATVMRLRHDGTFQVVATDGDVQLGGEDWDAALLEIVCDRYKQRNDFDPRQDPEFLQEARLKTVEAKKTLSERPKAEVTLAHRGKTDTVTVTRGEFQKKTEPLLTRTENTLKEMLERKEISWSHIDRILMVGGSSRMPMVSAMLERATGRVLDLSLPPDTAIAKGAALYAAHRDGTRAMPVKEILTVNSHPLGLVVRNAKSNKVLNDVLLQANEPTLKRVVRSYKIRQGAKALALLILLGDAPDPEACVYLGKGRITDLPKDLAPADDVDVTFCFLENGLLHVAGAVRRAGGEVLRDITFDVHVEGKMSEQEVDAARATLRGISID
jgi:molecular chaperone DnaK